jgi:hypothetical protein
MDSQNALGAVRGRRTALSGPAPGRLSGIQSAGRSNAELRLARRLRSTYLGWLTAPERTASVACLSSVTCDPYGAAVDHQQCLRRCASRRVLWSVLLNTQGVERVIFNPIDLQWHPRIPSEFTQAGLTSPYGARAVAMTKRKAQ